MILGCSELLPHLPKEQFPARKGARALHRCPGLPAPPRDRLPSVCLCVCLSPLGPLAPPSEREGGGFRCPRTTPPAPTGSAPSEAAGFLCLLVLSFPSVLSSPRGPGSFLTLPPAPAQGGRRPPFPAAGPAPAHRSRHPAPQDTASSCALPRGSLPPEAPAVPRSAPALPRLSFPLRDQTRPVTK